MSKKSERLAQLRKHRLAESQKKAGSPGLSAPIEDGVEEKKPKPTLRFPRRKLPNPLTLLPKKYFWPAVGLIALIALVCLCGILALILPATVPTPSPLMAAIVPPVQIVNRSFLPMYRVNYGCRFVALTDQTGFSFGPRVNFPDSRETQAVLPGRDKIPSMECVGGTNLAGIRVKSVEFRVSMSYFPFGWPFRRHLDYTVRSEFDERGQFQRWVVE